MNNHNQQTKHTPACRKGDVELSRAVITDKTADALRGSHIAGCIN